MLLHKLCNKTHCFGHDKSQISKSIEIEIHPARSSSPCLFPPFQSPTIGDSSARHTSDYGAWRQSCAGGHHHYHCNCHHHCHQSCRWSSSSPSSLHHHLPFFILIMIPILIFIFIFFMVTISTTRVPCLVHSNKENLLP